MMLTVQVFPPGNNRVPVFSAMAWEILNSRVGWRVYQARKTLWCFEHAATKMLFRGDTLECQQLAMMYYQQQRLLTWDELTRAVQAFPESWEFEELQISDKTPAGWRITRRDHAPPAYTAFGFEVDVLASLWWNGQ